MHLLNKFHGHSIHKSHPYFNVSPITVSTAAVLPFQNILTAFMTPFHLFSLTLNIHSICFNTTLPHITITSIHIFKILLAAFLHFSFSSNHFITFIFNFIHSAGGFSTSKTIFIFIKTLLHFTASFNLNCSFLSLDDIFQLFFLLCIVFITICICFSSTASSFL